MKKIISFIALAAVLVFFASCKNSGTSIDLIIESKQVGPHAYTVFHQKNPHIRFTLTRPSIAESKIVLAVAGTYTSPQNTVEGFVVLDGKIIQSRERQGWDAAAIFKNGTVEIIQTNNGRDLTKNKLQEIAEQGASLIQGHLLVMDSLAQSFKIQPLHRRRALAIRENSPVIIESNGILDLNEFANDLVQLGVKRAMNLDMGAWSEGWYRDPRTAKIITIGLQNYATDRQSNWIIFSQ